VDGDEDVHLEHRTVGFFRKFVSAVAGSNCNRQRVDAGALGELDRLVGIGDVIETAAACSVTVLSTVTPRSCAKSTTLRVTSTFSSKVEGVLPSVFREPSIMTEV
jgi:hypothetical protein